MKRRGNREGSLYLRPDGRWCGAIRIINRGRVYVYALTRDEAQKKLRAILNAQDAGEKITTPTRITFGALLNRWLEYQKSRVRPNTLKSYRDIIECHIRSQIGSVRLTALTPYHIEHALSLVSLSARSVRYVRQVMFMALRKAVQWELVRRNVAEAISGPKRQRSDIHPFTDDELASFLGAIKSDSRHALFLMAVTIGLRKGELLGLKWADYNMDGPTIHVQRTLQHGIEYPPKTESSNRTIKLPTALVEALRQWRTTQLEMRMKAGGKWREHGYVYTTSIGTPLDQRNVSRWLDKILTKAKIPHRRFHDLRHTCATHLLRKGARVDDVAALLGHASKSMTLDVYSHAIGNGSEVAALMDLIIG